MTMRFISSIPKAEFHMASQELVDDLLARNVKNRRVRSDHCSYLRNQMRDGNFLLTNQGIGIDTTGKLIDGQHRLTALKMAGYPPILLLIVFGLSEDAAQAVDQGINRTINDVLRFAFDCETSPVISSVARKFGIFVKGYTETRIAPIQIFEWYKEISATIHSLMQVSNASRVPSPMLVALVEEAERRPENLGKVMQFTEQFVTGVGLEKDAPALKLRNWNITMKGKSSADADQERYAKTKSAVTAFIEGRSLSRLQPAGYRKPNSHRQSPLYRASEGGDLDQPR